MKHSIQNSPPKFGMAAILAAGLMFGATQSALAANTAAGTDISNKATLSYCVNSVCGLPTIDSNIVHFMVDNKINLSVTGGTQKPVSPGQSNVVTPFTVTNLGNGTQGYNLSAANKANGAYTVTTAITDNFDPAAALTIYKDDGAGVPANAGDGVLSAAELAAGPITSIPSLAKNTSMYLVVMSNIALTNVDGDAAVVSLKAVTTWPTPLVAAEEPAAVVAGAVVTATPGADTALVVDVVLADALNPVTADVAYDGADTGWGAYKVASAVLSVAKAAKVICDPVNGNTSPKNIPGAVVQYAITITNAVGAASATLAQITDALNANLAFEPKLISGAGATPITTCTSAGGVQQSPTTGFNAIRGTGTTTYTGAQPGTVAQAVTAGADFGITTPGVVTINFGTLAGTAYGVANGVLPANSFVTVYFNTIVQ